MGWQHFGTFLYKLFCKPKQFIEINTITEMMIWNWAPRWAQTSMVTNTLRIPTIFMDAIVGLSLPIMWIWIMMVPRFPLSGMDGCTIRWDEVKSLQLYISIYFSLQTDLPPHRDGSRPKYKWMSDHSENLSGTKGKWYILFIYLSGFQGWWFFFRAIHALFHYTTQNWGLGSQKEVNFRWYNCKHKVKKLKNKMWKF